MADLKSAPTLWKLKKCESWLEVVLLGHVVSKEGIKINPKAIIDLPRPTNATETISFLGLARYYRQVMKDFLKMASALTNLLKKATKFILTEKCEKAFQELRHRLIAT